MSLSGLLRAAWVAVPAALVCGGAVARQIITVPSGTVIVLTQGEMPVGVMSRAANLPVLVETRQPAAVTTLPMPLERIFAEQQAMMDRMMAEMNAMLSPGADPVGIIRAMTGRMSAPAQEVSPARGGTFCQESISVSYNGHGSAPVVKVSRTGGGCGPEAGDVPLPAETRPPAVSHPHVIHSSDLFVGG